MADAARNGQTAFALRLAKLLAPVGDVDETAADCNVVFSPFSVHAGLALVAAGARGATQAQLLSFLGAPSAAELAAFGRRVTQSILAGRTDALAPRVFFGGGIWVDESRGSLNKAFRDVAVDCYKSEVRTVSFTNKPGEALEMINNWVKKATKNLIDSVFSSNDITPATDLVLANAVYFNAMWEDEFNSLYTSNQTFYHLDGSQVQAQFMSKTGYDYLSCMHGFKILRLPYRNGDRNKSKQYSMFIFLPDERQGFANMVDVITAAPGYMYSILPKSSETKFVHLRLPKFAITFNWDVERDLRRLGLSLPFSTEMADLGGMCEKDDSGRPMFLSTVAHKAVVKVDELGTEAAAAFGSLRGGGGPKLPDIVEFIADHPFTFLIMEERSGVIVFAGHVLDPTK